MKDSDRHDTSYDYDGLTIRTDARTHPFSNFEKSKIGSDFDSADDALIERLANLADPIIVRASRGTVIALLASLLIYLGPLPQNHYMLYGIAVGAMAATNATKYFAGLALLLLLIIAMMEPYLVRLL